MSFSNLCGVEKDRGDTEKNNTGSIKKDNTALTTKKKKKNAFWKEALGANSANP